MRPLTEAVPSTSESTAASRCRRLVLVRHGRTSWNVDGRFQGHADPELDAVGHGEAARAATLLEGHLPVQVLSSDLRRARQTACYFVRRTGRRVTVDAGLREVDLGGWEGLSREEAALAFPDEYRAWVAGVDVARGGGETAVEAGDRAADVLEAALAAAPPGGAVVAVSHGLVLQAAIRSLTGRAVIAAPPSAPHLPNGGWIVCVEQR